MIEELQIKNDNLTKINVELTKQLKLKLRMIILLKLTNLPNNLKNLLKVM